MGAQDESCRAHAPAGIELENKERHRLHVSRFTITFHASRPGDYEACPRISRMIRYSCLASSTICENSFGLNRHRLAPSLCDSGNGSGNSLPVKIITGKWLSCGVARINLSTSNPLASGMTISKRIKSGQ